MIEVKKGSMLSKDLSEFFCKTSIGFDINIFHGDLGISLFEMFYLKSSKNEELESVAMNRVLQAYRDLLSSQKHHDNDKLINGWLLAFLVNNKLLDLNLDEMLEEIDRHLCIKVQTTFSSGIKDLLTKGTYLLERLKCTNDNFTKGNVIETLAYILEEIEYLLEQNKYDNDCEPLKLDLLKKFEFETLALYFLHQIKPHKIFVFKQEKLENKLLPLYEDTINQIYSNTEISKVNKIEKFLISHTILNVTKENAYDLKQQQKWLSVLSDAANCLMEASIQTKIICCKMICILHAKGHNTAVLNELGAELMDQLSSFLNYKISKEKNMNSCFTNKGLGGLSGIGLLLLESNNPDVLWENIFLLF